MAKMVSNGPCLAKDLAILLYITFFSPFFHLFSPFFTILNGNNGIKWSLVWPKTCDFVLHYLFFTFFTILNTAKYKRGMGHGGWAMDEMGQNIMGQWRK